MENSTIAIGAGLFLLVAIGAFLLIPISDGRTLILTTPSNSTGGCSDLDCLSDVVIIIPSTNQTLIYNGTHWVNSNQTSFSDSTTCQNIGSGTALICVEGTNVNLRSILAGTGISATNSSNTITITNTLPEATTCVNLGSSSSLSEGIFASGNCNFKRLLEGTSITLSSNSTHITITNSKPEQGCTSAGGTSIWKTTTTCDAKGLTAGVGLTLTSNTNDNNYKTNFANGTGITITGTTTQTFSSQCANTGSGEAICESSNNINSLIATSPLTVTDTTGDLTIACDTCWIQLDNSSPSDGATTWTSGTFTAKKYMIWELYIKNDATTVTAGNAGIRFNGDTGNNYDGCRYVASARTCSTVASSNIFCSLDENFAYYSTAEIYNVASQKKGIHLHVTPLEYNGQTGDQECELYGDWQNTSNAITSITLFRSAGTWAFDSTSTLVIYGHD